MEKASQQNLAVLALHIYIYMDIPPRLFYVCALLVQTGVLVEKSGKIVVLVMGKIWRG